MKSTENIIVGTPVGIASHTLLPIEKTTILYDENSELDCFYASKELVAFVVKTPSSVLFYDVATGQTTLEDLQRVVPDIATYLRPVG